MLVGMRLTCKTGSYAIDSRSHSAYNKLSETKGGSMKIDQNKKILMGVVVILYVLYKMMGG